MKRNDLRPTWYDLVRLAIVAAAVVAAVTAPLWWPL